jgi:hypothetical protein
MEFKSLCVSGLEEAVSVSVLSPQPYSTQNYLVTVKVMTTGVGRKIQYKKINLCVVDTVFLV